ncbi:hypothetical protein Spb1_12980 [Planctopirus ephydatiae]|uniref:Uncharacterized protein n=1 Tax=Planctopirus ephydatiae TaxID=2528019 RepID=A0A518GL61_9PLAN|nr:hypothetical protein Spb1_12980 [Planctopirus ephydatiae]
MTNPQPGEPGAATKKPGVTSRSHRVTSLVGWPGLWGQPIGPIGVFPISLIGDFTATRSILIG